MKPARVLPGLVVLALFVVALSVAFPISVPSDVQTSDSYTQGTVEVEGGEIDADATHLWGETQRATGRNVNVTPTVVIREFDGALAGTATTTEDTAFQRLLVYDDPEEQPPGGVLAYVTPFSTDVNVNADRFAAVQAGRSTRSVEGLLVHEFTHLVQYQTPAFRENQQFGLSTSSDETRAYNAMVEGGAEFVADDYVEESIVERTRAYWNDPETSAAARLGQWPYYRGLVYLDERLDDPTELWDVYEDRPATTAALLRGETSGDGPPDRSISLGIEDYHTEVEDRPGAALAEVALTKAIDPERARDVAAGWQWGALRSIEPDNGPGEDPSLRHVWVTEWQSEGEADAFEEAMTEYLDHRWTEANGTWSSADGPSLALERVDDNSIALLAGPDGFLANATVTVEGDEYSIESTDGAATAPVGDPTAADAAHVEPFAAGDAPATTAANPPAADVPIAAGASSAIPTP